MGVNIHSFFTGSAPTSIDVSYFQIERYGALTPPPSATAVFDDFDAPLDPDWDWYVPKDGPTHTTGVDEFTFTLPAYENFKHGTEEDNQCLHFFCLPCQHCGLFYLAQQ